MDGRSQTEFSALTLVIPREREEVYEEMKKTFELANKVLSDSKPDTALSSRLCGSTLY